MSGGAGAQAGGVFDPSRYYGYEEMTGFLQAWAVAYPSLMRLAEIGRSAQGRSIWAVALTNTETGEAEAKPGYLVDANTHAGEVTGGAAALYSIWWLLTRYGADPLATELLDTRAFYVVPRLAVDGVETYLTTPHWLRSSDRPYPLPLSELPPGLYAEDIDGDGMILQMRIRDAEGDWKADPQDPRAMVLRHPEERGDGPYYRLYVEGRIQDWDGRAVVPGRTRWGLDFNRNYPAFWNPEGQQAGAGRFPLSEPETKALADFLLAHRNIGAYVAYHTTGCVLLRPPSNGGDDKLNQADLAGFKQVGEMCTRINGYRCTSTYGAFAYPGQESLVKGADDWAYEHLGVQAFTFELWSIDVRAGARSYAEIGVAGLLKLSEAEQAEDERKRLAFNDQALEGKGFVTWRSLLHPQLGPVELGGWDYKWALQNPPPGPLLLAEIEKCAEFTFRHALTLPQLGLTLEAAPLGAGLYKLSARVVNAGGLATNVTEVALTMKAVRPIEVRLEPADGLQLVGGEGRQELGQLPGWLSPGSRSPVTEAWADWVVRAKPGTRVRVTAESARAGRVSQELVIAT